MVGQQRVNSAPCQLAVTDFAAAGKTRAANFANRIGREVVVQHEAFLAGTFERVDELLVVARAKRRNHQRLGLAARKQGGSVRAFQHMNFGLDRAHGAQVALVDTLFGLEDVAAHHIFFDALEAFAQ